MAQATSPRTRPVGRALLPLGLMFLAVGIALALVVPFLALFLSTDVGAGPVQVTVFLFVAPLAGVVAAWVIGRLSDRRSMRRGLLIGAALCGFVGSLLTAFIRDYWVLLGLAVTATAAANALFPQTFAYAREVLQRDNPARSAMGISGLRTVFSVAWVAGPPLAAVLLQAGGFGYVYGVAAGTYLVAAAVATFWLAPLGPATAPQPDAGRAIPVTGAAPPASRRTLLLAAVAFTLLQCPLTLGAQALPLYVSRDLNGDVGDAGLLLGLCAALEIPLMLALGALSTRIPLRILILGGAACGVAYYGLATLATAVWMLYALQLVNALFIAAVTGLGISFVQDLLPAEPGRATTLFTNTFPIGAMLAGPLFGLAQHFGFRLAFAMATGLCLAGMIVLAITPRLALSRARTG